MRITHTIRSLALSSLFIPVLLAGCADDPFEAEVAEATHAVQSSITGGVIQHVTVGSNDLCPALGFKPGCDANFSLVANKYADGTVRGQWQDGFGKDTDGSQLGGMHAAIDCLEIIDYPVGIYVFQVAWVSGVVTMSSNPSFTAGEGVITLAVERGTSSNDLFQDLASYTVPLRFFPAGTTCADMPNLPVFLNNAFIGQVDMWSR